MTGRYPDTTACWNFGNDFRNPGEDGRPAVGADWTTLPGYFKQHSYLTVGGGKTFHPGEPEDYDSSLSWSSEVPYYPFEEVGCTPGTTVDGNWHVCPEEAPDDAFFDYRVVNHSLLGVRTALELQRPFAVFNGFRRPHIPWRMPMRFWDLYGDDLPLAEHQTIGTGISALAYTQCGFVTTEQLPYGPESPLANATQRSYRRGYYAATSWMDSQVGRLLDGLDALGQTDSTLVVLFGDHGYKLGEHGGWGKQDVGAARPSLTASARKTRGRGAGCHRACAASVATPCGGAPRGRRRRSPLS